MVEHAAKLAAFLFLLMVGTAAAQTVVGFQGQVYMSGDHIHNTGPQIVTNFNDILVNHLVSGTFAASASTFTTATVAPAPAPNSLIMVDVVNTKATIADSPTSVTAFGLTFNQLTNCPFGTSSTNNHTLWIAQGAAPTSTTIAVAFGASQLGCLIECYEFQGANVGASAVNAIVATYTNGVTAASANPTVNYTAPAQLGTNALMRFVADNVNDTTSIVQSTNWFRHEKIAHGTTISGLASFFQVNALSATSATDTASSRAWSIIMVEVKPSLMKDPTTQPVMVQHKSWNTIDSPATAGAKFFTNWLSNVTLSQNMLDVHVVYDQQGDASRAISLMSDNLGSTYVKTFAVTNQDVCEDWILTNNPGGISWINVNFTTGVTQDYHFEFTEYAHVALYNPYDAGNSSAPSAVSMDYGSITSSIDGDLIVGHAIMFNGAPPINPNHDTVREFYSGLGAVDGWLSTQFRLIACSQYAVQAKAATVDPLLYTAGASASGAQWLNQTLCFKRGPGGTIRPPALMYIARCQADWYGTGGFVSLLPFRGNLWIISDSVSLAGGTDSGWASYPAPASTWTVKKTATADGPQFAYLSNTVSSYGIPANVTLTSAHTIDPGFAYDVFYASPYPFDLQTDANNGGASVPANSMITNTFTPTFAGSLMIEECTTGTGPFAGYVMPPSTGFVFDSTWYPGSDDLNKLNQGTGNGTYYITNVALVKSVLVFSNTPSTSSYCDDQLVFKPGNH